PSSRRTSRRSTRSSGSCYRRSCTTLGTGSRSRASRCATGSSATCTASTGLATGCSARTGTSSSRSTCTAARSRKCSARCSVRPAVARRPSRQRRRRHWRGGAHRRAHGGPGDPACDGRRGGPRRGATSFAPVKNPVRVAVTGAAGQIGYSLVFRIANGDLLGPDQPVVLSLLEITPALGALQGVVMELQDCAFPLLHGVETSDDASRAFEGVNYALLVGSRPRTKGMARKDLLEANGAIF